MAGELRLKQFVNDEVKPVIRKTLPEILARLEALEKATKPKTSKPKAPTEKKTAKKKPKVKESTVAKAIIPKAKKAKK